MKSLKKLVKLFFEDRARGILLIVMLMISGVCVAAEPKVLGKATDALAEGITNDKINWEGFFFFAGVCVVIYVIQFSTKYLAGRMANRMSSGVAKRLRREVEEKLWKLPLNYYDTKKRGDIMSCATNDIDNVVTTLNSTGCDFFYYSLMLISMVIMMFSSSWLLAIITMLMIIVSFTAIRVITKKASPQYKKQWGTLGMLNARIEESFNGHNIIKAYSQEEVFKEQFREQNEVLFEASFKASAYSNLVQPLSRFLTNLNYVIVALFSAKSILSGKMTFGDAQAFIQYARQFQQPFTQIANMITSLHSGIASFERVSLLLEEEEEKPDEAHAKDDYVMKGAIEFKNVFFSYVEDRKLIENMNLTVKPGQMVAIVGGTGAGKTTLVNLIERFYEVNSGKIILDGKEEIHDITRSALRRNIAMVLQDTWLYNGTIEDNLKYGRVGGEAVSDEEFQAACADTFVDSFVKTLPNGYQTVVSNELTSVSDGEKQLLTICRAFLAKPNILILDEATSSVDTRTEALIQKALDKLREGKTSFVIAHRLSTIRNADIILVMDNGHIVEQGNHEELLSLNGVYAKLYQAQFSE